MARMRTIDKAAEHIRELDPDTALTKTALRRMVISATVPSVRVGQKYLLNLDVLENYLLGSNVEEKQSYGGIREVRV